MNETDLLKKKTIVNRILVFIIIVLIVFGIVSYKKYYDEKRQQEIGNTIGNAMEEDGTRIAKVENNLSVMDKMSFSENGNALFISICCFSDDELKLGELADTIDQTKEELWFTYDYVVIEIWNSQIGMVTSIETNLGTMETRSYDWYDK